MTRLPAFPSYVLAAALLTAAPAQSQELKPVPQRPTITVAEFVTDRTAWMPPPGLGQTLAELLTDRLVTAGPYRVMDRAWLAADADHRSQLPLALLRERALSAGIDYVVLGSVTELSIERESTSRMGLLPVPLAGGIVRKHKTESAIGLTLRVIDVHTGEVVATSTAHSGASHQNTSNGGGAIVAHLPLLVGSSSSTLGVQDRLLVTAVQQAITDAADQIIEAAPRLAPQAGH